MSPAGTDHDVHGAGVGWSTGRPTPAGGPAEQTAGATAEDGDRLLRVETPDEPPPLTPTAAEALMRLLRHAMHTDGAKEPDGTVGRTRAGRQERP